MEKDREKLTAQRAAIREHIQKYLEYSVKSPEAVNMALRTVRNCQNQVVKILLKHPHWDNSWEDTWTP